MSKKKNNIYSSIMSETLGYGTAGIVATSLSIPGEFSSMNAFRIGSSLAGVPSLMSASKKVMKGLEGW